MKYTTMRRTMAAAGLVALYAGLSSAVCAQTAPTTDEHVRELERKLEQSLKRIDELSRKVERLEAGGAPAAGTQAQPAPAAGTQAPPAPVANTPAQPAAAAAQNQRIDELESEVRQLSQSVSRVDTDTGVPLHGFANIDGRFFSRTDPSGDNVHSGVVEKAIEFYLTPNLGPRVKLLTEIAIETGEYSESVNIDMERLQIGYVQSDELTVWAGRFHTPYGYWNTAFHHGAQIQTSIQRPKFLAFEDTYGMMPAHTVGFLATGKKRLGDGRMTYDFAVGNSQRILTSGGQPGTGQVDMNLLGSSNNSASVLFNLGYEFGSSLDGLKLGIDAMRWNATDDVAPLPNTTHMGFVGAYGAYTADDWEVLGEYYLFHDTNASGDGSSHSSSAYYLQAGRTFGSFTPYTRWESAHLNQNDNYFAVLAPAIGSSYWRDVVGLRYDLTRSTAFKFELNRTFYRDQRLPSYNELGTQVAVRF
ncbi:MAG TPA: hypothetical protein VH183_02665 [Burkholderiaceae bacterium]|jgi:hypothetical protein|nr:hypothetical protein [Burkholderiaceae bacterium]